VVNISPSAYVATEDCPITGRSFFVYGGSVHLFQPWATIDKIETDQRWTLDELTEEAPRLADVPFSRGMPWG
jgi:predicted ATPase